MKHHYCPTCERPYGCPRAEADCGSPNVYDCHGCYQRRYRKELAALVASVAARFGDDQSCAGYGDVAVPIEFQPRTTPSPEAISEMF
ncbi:MAG: hypothetical protein LAO06_08045 [Acidobacteriia bacterium]|nr:hypothetical protein [Terriglobia bacterium]